MSLVRRLFHRFFCEYQTVDEWREVLTLSSSRGVSDWFSTVQWEKLFIFSEIQVIWYFELTASVKETWRRSRAGVYPSPVFLMVSVMMWLHGRWLRGIISATPVGGADPRVENRWFSAAVADGCHYFGWNWIMKQRLQRIDSIDLKCWWTLHIEGNLNTQKVNLMVALEEKSSDPKWFGLILWEPWISSRKK